MNADGLWVRDLLHQTAADLDAKAQEDDQEQDDDMPGAGLPQMELQPFEHYDYIMLLFRNDQDFQRGCEVLGIQKVQITYPGGLQKIGLGMCVHGARVVEKLAERSQ